MNQDLQKLAMEFCEIARIAGVEVPHDCMKIEYLPAPHMRLTLEAGQMAVYVFAIESECLKVGKAGPNSFSRYKHQR